MAVTDDVRGDFTRERFHRKELTQLKLRAEWLARQPNQSPTWIRAYQDLADSADRVDALIYRAVGIARERQDDLIDDEVDG